MRAQVRKAFTLVEILIVVVILGILAAIVIPQFTNASEEAQASSAASQLSTVRNQIELFRVRNNGTPPAEATLFDDEGQTEPAGGWTTIVNADYLRAAPVNPRTGNADVDPGVESDSQGEVDTTSAGWIYNETTGEIWMNGFDEETQQWYPLP